MAAHPGILISILTVLAALADGGGTRFSYHYYDVATRGCSRLAIGTIDWSDDWPVPVK
jgi:hypothetical protein